MEKHLTYDELVEKTGIKKSTLYAFVSQKRIPHIRLSGRCVRFNEREIEDWMKAHHVSAKDGE